MNYKVISLIFLIFCILIIIKTYQNNSFSTNRICQLAQENCPQSQDFNSRFDELATLLNTAFPYRAVNGTEVKWNEIYSNLDEIIRCLKLKNGEI